MGAIRWTGKAFQLVGRILTNEDFENWLKNEGQELFKRELERMSKKWFFAKWRTEKLIKKELSEFEGAGEAFRSALSKELNSLPMRISEAANLLTKSGPKELVEETSYNSVTAVPRKTIVERYQSSVVEELQNAAALRNFPGLAKRMLLQRTKEAENEFFIAMRKKGNFITNPEGEVLLEIDFDTEWWKAEVKGHYYVARSAFLSARLNDKEGLAKFLATVNPLKDRLQDRIGRIDIKDMNTILAKLDAIDFTSR